jgi:hypothetical protein
MVSDEEVRILDRLEKPVYLALKNNTIFIVYTM